VCNRYVSPAAADLEGMWSLKKPSFEWARQQIFPKKNGLFLRTSREPGTNELVAGQWGLIPWFSKTSTITYSTNNCRSETVATAASFRSSWKDAKRCIVPAWEFFEPNWETGKNEWWSFKRADQAPFALAGIWNSWNDKVSGEIVESYSMLTINADDHPIMKRMHKPDPKLSPSEQDKRSVVIIENADVETWLNGEIEHAIKLIRLTDASDLMAKPESI
jgi:putative SOS response-associated peptidase YedK